MVLKDIEVDITQAKGGVLKVKANGWDVATDAVIDSLEFIDKSTQTVVEKIASAYKGGNDYESIVFTKDKYQSGDGTMDSDKKSVISATSDMNLLIPIRCRKMQMATIISNSIWTKSMKETAIS